MSSIIGRPIIAGEGGTAKRLEFTYTGQYNEREDGVLELLSTGIITFKKITIVDVFLVGGGSSGASADLVGRSAATGGAGGYTKTFNNIALKANTKYSVVVGLGGASPTEQKSPGNKGGNSSAFGNVAEGGKVSTSFRQAGNGGSGGGGADASTDGVTGGSNGGNGSGRIGAGYGQGSTTREFGEASGKLYAAGGGGGTGNSVWSYGGEGGGGKGGSYKGAYDSPTHGAPTSGEANTGSGGGGGYYGFTDVAMGAAGGSGIVCIRLQKAT